MCGGQSGEFVSNSRQSFKRGVHCFHVKIHTLLPCFFSFVVVHCFFFRLIRVNKIRPLQYTGIVVGVLIVTNEYSSVKKLCVCF